MKFQEGENSNRSEPEGRRKTRAILLITDNRPKQLPDKGSMPDFRQSAFKQTEVDPLQVWAQMNAQHEQDSLIEHLNRKLVVLEERIKKMEKQSQDREHDESNVSQQRDKKHRRKFAQMQRKCKCPYIECERIYGSETSLKHHLKIKHNRIVQESVNEKKGKKGEAKPQNKQN